LEGGRRLPNVAAKRGNVGLEDATASRLEGGRRLEDTTASRLARNRFAVGPEPLRGS
jgi:hypothetical protein